MVLTLCLAWSTASQAALPDPVGYWRFNGNYNDEGTCGHNGTASSPSHVSIVSDTDRGQVVQLDGAGWVNINHGVTELGNADFSIAAWIKWTGGTITTQAGGCIVSKSDGDGVWESMEKQLYINEDILGEGGSDGTIDYVGWGCDFIRGSDRADDGGWHHVCLTWDVSESEGHVYVDGVEGTSSVAFSGGADNGPDTVRIGFGPGEHSTHFVGRLDDVAIFNAELTASQVMELSGLLAHWKFDDGTGSSTAADETGNYDGTLVNMNTSTCWVEGMDGGGLDFDGSNDFVDVNVPGAHAQMTICLWMKYDSLPEDYISIISHDEWGDAGAVHFNLFSGGGVEFCVSSGSDVLCNTTLNSGVWYHVAVTYDNVGGEGHFYVNGSPSGDNMSVGGANPLIGAAAIGAWYGNGREYDGIMDDFRIYDRALGATGIWNIYIDTIGVDVFPPEPDPATWASEPHGIATDKVSMAATPGTDWTPPIKYYFEEMSGKPGGTDSGWQTDSTYTDIGLTEGETYTYRVRMRDSADPCNTGDWSAPASGVAQDPFAGLDFDEILFIKRPTFGSDHFYTDFINGCYADRFRTDNGIYRYNLDTQTVTPVITAPDMFAETGSNNGIFYRMDLSFDATKIVFDYKPSNDEGFRIWECNLDGTGLTQLTTTPPDEAGNITEYWMPGYGGTMNLFNYHYDDMHPCYSPDGKIIFTSTRCKITTLCDYDGVLVTPVLYRMDADGGNMEKLTDSPVSEFTPSVMPDGRILYTRWEYVDKTSVRIKCLMAMKPDGTTPEEIWGLDHMDPASVMHGRSVPGAENLVVATGCPHYPQGNSLGEIMLIDTNKDIRTTHAMTRITPNVRMNYEGGWEFWTGSGWDQDESGTSGRLYTNPYPLSKDLFLVSCKNTSDHWGDLDGYDIHLLDSSGNVTLIYGESDTSCWHPMPLKSREIPKIPVTRINPSLAASNHAQCLVTDVYQGLEGVSRGDIKYLRVNLVISRPWSAHRIKLWGWLSPEEGEILSSTGWRGALWPRVQLGIVPVEEDGSANFIVPADRNIQLQALDENYMEVQRERTYFNMRPGEVRSCIGCHERTGRAASIPTSYAFPQAMANGPVTPAPQPGESAGTGNWAGWGTNVIHYESDIQPIWEATRTGGTCVSCHSGGSPPHGLDLTGGVTENYNVSYDELTAFSSPPAGYNTWDAGTRYLGLIIEEVAAHEQEADNNGAFFGPYTLGSHDSYLIGVLRGDHDATLSEDHAGKLTTNELIQVITWVDANAQYYGSYYGRHHGSHSGHVNFRPVPTFEEAISPDAPSWHD